MGRVRRQRTRTSILVVGGGVSGCAAAKELQSRGLDYLVIDKNGSLGGLTRSVMLDEAVFDYTGHFLHLARFASPSGIPHAGLRDDDWQRVERRSYVSVADCLVPAPFQYNLGHLPAAQRKACIDAFRDRPRIPKPVSFSEYLLSGFGTGICELFLFPYNQKLQAMDLCRLSPSVVNRFFPRPDAHMIERGCASRLTKPEASYNSRFWYPKKGGIGRLASGLSRELRSVQTSCTLRSVALRQRCAHTSQGVVHYERLLTSMPLKDFCARTDDPELRMLASALSHTRVACVNILARRRPPEPLRDAHWVYLPDPGLPIYRVGFYSNVSAEMAPPGHTAMYAELAHPSSDRRVGIGSATDDCVNALVALGWLRRGDITAIAANWIQCAYVHLLHDTAERVVRITARLSGYGVHPIGRYGTWDYVSMEDSILQSIEIATEVARS